MSGETNSIRNKWKAFVEVIGTPLAIFLLISTLGLIIALQFEEIKESGIITAILTLLISLFSGVIGGVYSKRWDDQSQTTVNEVRGRQALNNLRLIFGQLLSLENRVESYLSNNSDESLKKRLPNEVINTYFEETINKTYTLQEAVVKAMSDWEEILPETKDLFQHFSELRELTTEYRDKEQRMKHLRSYFRANGEKSQLEASTYNKLIEDVESLKRLRKEIRNNAEKMGTPVSNRVEELFKNSRVQIHAVKNQEGVWVIDDKSSKEIAEDS